ncbi:hypothetical protein ACFE04_001229 [Oxalis oulophora]
MILCPKRIKTLVSTCKHKTTITQIHALMIVTGLISHGTSPGSLIASYARINQISLAHQVFDQTPKPGIHAWNAMIVACSRADKPNEVLGLYENIIFEGVKPDSSIFTVAIKACISLNDWEMGEEVWRKAIGYGYENDVFVGSSVLNLYSKCRMMDKAVAVFDKMPRKDLVCWTTLVTGFTQSRQPREAIHVCRRMLEEGMEFDKVVMLGLSQACADLGDLKMGLSVHGYMIKRDLLGNIEVQNNLVNMYAKNGHLELATRVVKNITNQHVVHWNTLISGFAQNGFASNALELLVEMQNYGFKPNSASLVSALLACSQVGFLKLGKSMHGHIVRKRFDFDQVLSTAIIDMYSKCGEISCAQKIFDLGHSKDTIAWNAMIAGYGSHGSVKEALSLFLQMTEAGLKPDDITFASLLSALSHTGLVEEGRHWFNLMVSEYNIKPSEKHYVCMVDLLARAGKVEEAYEMIKSIDTEPSLAIWAALLSGCHNHRKLVIGEKVARKILELNREDLGIHALVTNFFAMGKNWEEVAGVRKIMKYSEFKKVPGYSAVEVNGRLNTFLKNDGTHHRYNDIVSMLNKVNREMRAEGYIPQTFIHHLDDAKHENVLIKI